MKVQIVGFLALVATCMTQTAYGNDLDNPDTNQLSKGSQHTSAALCAAQPIPQSVVLGVFADTAIRVTPTSLAIVEPLVSASIGAVLQFGMPCSWVAQELVNQFSEMCSRKCR